MPNSVDPDETAHYEPSHQDLHCLKKEVWVCRNERFYEQAALVYVDWSGYSPFPLF